MKGVYAFIFFALGAAAGTAVTWKLTAKRAADLAKDEIESVKAAYSRREADKTAAKENLEKPDIMSFYSDSAAAAMKEYGGKDSSKSTEEEEIECISPDAFGENEDYEQIYVTRYADEVLAYDDDEIVTKPDEIFGKDWAEHFGEYDADTLLIRNDSRKAYYEITRSERNYKYKG